MQDRRTNSKEGEKKRSFELNRIAYLAGNFHLEGRGRIAKAEGSTVRVLWLDIVTGDASTTFDIFRARESSRGMVDSTGR